MPMMGGRGGGSAGGGAASVGDGVVGSAAGGERSDDNAESIEDDSFELPIVPAVATGERMSSKRRRVDAVVPSLTTQYGALTTVSSKSSMSDDELFNYFDERLQGREREMVCGNKNCICLDIFLSLNVREAVAK